MNEAAEECRRGYRPEIIKVLFIGESPPAGGTFFYYANSNLSRFTERAFEQVYGSEIGTGKAFLEFFKSLGCYLDDLCLTPVNKLDNRARNQLCQNSVPSYAARMKEYNPLALIAVKLSIRKQAEEAQRLAGMGHIPLWVVPFPTMGNQPRYIKELSAVLRELQGLNLI